MIAVTLDDRADQLRRAAAADRGLHPDALLPFEVLTDSEREMWRQRATTEIRTGR